MALARILVDGYSLLHQWPELAPGRARHSAAARDELISIITHYQDASGTPITVFFDGSGAPPNTPKPHSSPQVEVLFSKAGQTADQMIERAAYRFQPYGEVLAVTDDNAIRDLVVGMGGSIASCANFIRMIGGTQEEMQADLKNYNRMEQNRYRKPR